MILTIFTYLSFLLFSFGQLGRISFFGQQINFYLYELCLLLALFSFSIKYGVKPIFYALNKFRILFIFLFYLLISFLVGTGKFTPFENFIGVLYWLRLTIYFLFFIYLNYHLKKQPVFVNTLKKGFNIFVSLTLITSIVQYFYYPDLRNLIYAGWDPHLYRIFGTFLDTSIAGAIYGLIFITLFLKDDELINNKWINLSLTGMYMLLIVLTYSRALYLAILFILMLQTVTQKRFKTIILLILFFITLIFLAPKPFGEGVNLSRIFSLKSRWVDYQVGTKIWEKNPILGIGYNRIRYSKLKLNIIEAVGSDITHSGASFHSSFLTVLVSGGIIGLILFLLVLLKFAKINLFSRNLVIFLSLFSLSDNVLLHPFLLLLLLTLIPIFSINPSRK